MKPFFAVRLSPALCIASQLLLLAPLTNAEEATGIAQPVKDVTVASPVQDIISEIKVEEGAVVKKGDTLALLQNAKENINVQLTSKQCELNEFTSRGMEKLLSEKMVSKEVALQKSTEYAISQLQHQLALEQLKDKTIKAPMDGIVVKKFKEAGEAVERTEKMFEILNISQLNILFYLEPKYLNRIKLDQTVEVTFPDAGSEKVSAKVTFVEPRIDAASGLFRVKLQIDNANERIKAGMKGNADFDSLK